MARLLEKYRSEVLPVLQKELGRKNIHDLPYVDKISINMGLGKGLTDSKFVEQAVEDLTTIAGQKAVITKARVAVSNFKVRQGFTVGCKVTIRGKRMYEFLDRLMNAAMPRIRDFRGVSAKGFDGQGNFSMGLEEQTIFPEIDPDKSAEAQGMDINIVIKGTRGADESRLFLKEMGMPFAK
jgi:large subunit ribosomal protein L5